MQPDSSPQRVTVANVLDAHPVAARVFSRHKIDFCCRGGVPLSDAASAAKVTVEALLAEIAREETPSASVDWETRPISELVAHIVERHHRPLDSELPRLLGLAMKVAKVHGGPLNEAVLERTRALVDDLVPHFQKEEQILFPLILAGDYRRALGPIHVMHDEHDLVGAILAELRVTTEDYTPPSQACASWRALWQGLDALEADLHLHIHLENNHLFPRVAREAHARPR
ncbi:MAG: iron-sulfur cluster repair di-iron protein [Myxococcota bacterium]